MGQTSDEISPRVAERWCSEVACRDDSRVVRRLHRSQVVDGVYRQDEGAWLDDFCHFRDQVGVMALLDHVHGVAIQRQMVPCVPYVLLYGLKTLGGIERTHALPRLLFSDVALMSWVGFKAQQVRDGVCQCGGTNGQGQRPLGPMSPDTLAKNIVYWQLPDLEGVFYGVIRALAKTGGFGAKVTGIADGTDLDTTERDTGCGQVTRQVRLEDQRGRVHAIDVTVSGGNVLLVIDAATKIPLAVTVAPIQEHEALWTRALVT